MDTEANANLANVILLSLNGHRSKCKFGQCYFLVYLNDTFQGSFTHIFKARFQSLYGQARKTDTEDVLPVHCTHDHRIKHILVTFVSYYKAITNDIISLKENCVCSQVKLF